MESLKLHFVYQQDYFYFNPPSEGSVCLNNDLFEITHTKFDLSNKSLEKAHKRIEEINADINIIYRPDYLNPTKKTNSLNIGIATEIYPRKYDDVIYSDKSDFLRLNHLLSAPLEGYHSIISYDKYNINLLKELINIPIYFYPLTVNNSLVKESQSEDKKIYKEYDVAFIGHINQRRADFLSRLKPYFKCLYIDHGAYNLIQMQDFCSKAKVQLNINANYGITREVRTPLLNQFGFLVASEKIYEDSFYTHPQKMTFNIDNITEVVNEILGSYKLNKQIYNANWEKYREKWSINYLLKVIKDIYIDQKNRVNPLDSSDPITENGKHIKSYINSNDLVGAERIVKTVFL